MNKHSRLPQEPDYEKLRPCFGWVKSDTVKQTIDQTTQWRVAVDSFLIKRCLKFRNPAVNVPRRHDPVATEAMFSDTPAVHSGVSLQKCLWGEIH